MGNKLMDDEIRNKIETYIYNFALMQDFLVVWDVLNNQNISPDDLRKYIEEKKANIMRADKTVKKWENTAPKCPECGGPLVVRPVNTSPGNQVGGDSRFQFSCLNPECLYEEFIIDKPEVIHEISV